MTNDKVDEKRGLTNDELKQLRARFKKRQDKFTAITGQKQIRISAGPSLNIPSATSDDTNDEEAFENVNVDINPVQLTIQEKTMVLQSAPGLFSENSALGSTPQKLSSSVTNKTESKSSLKSTSTISTNSQASQITQSPSPSSHTTQKTSQKSKPKKSITSTTSKSSIKSGNSAPSKPTAITATKERQSKGKTKQDVQKKDPKMRKKETKVMKKDAGNGTKEKDKEKVKKGKKEKDKSRDGEKQQLRTCEENEKKIKGGEEQKKVEDKKKEMEKRKDKRKVEKKAMKADRGGKEEKRLKASGGGDVALKISEVEKKSNNKSNLEPINEEKLLQKVGEGRKEEIASVAGNLQKFEYSADEKKPITTQEQIITQPNVQTEAVVEPTISPIPSTDKAICPTSSMDSFMQSLEISKKDQSLYEKMDNEIILDTNILQSLATDLTKGSTEVNRDVIGEDFANKLIEIEKKDQSSTEQNFIIEDEPAVLSEVATTIVEALTSSHVLGKVLTPEEANILRDYFSRKIPLNEKVLATLDTALDKILRRAHEFYTDKEKLDSFLKDRNSAKAKLLDALIAKKSTYLADLMSDASYYADRISKGLIDAYQLATKGILVAKENFEYMQAAVGYTYRYSKDMAYRGKELAEIGAAVGAKMTYDAAKLTYDAANRGKEIAGIGAAVGAKMTYDAAKLTYDAANRGKELAEIGAAVGAKMSYDAARMTQNVATCGKELAQAGVCMTTNAASKGLELAEGTIQVAAKGTEMVKNSLTSVGITALGVSGNALESAAETTDLVAKKVQSFGSVVTQAGSGLQQSGKWLLSFLQPSTVPSETQKKQEDGSDSNGDDDDDDGDDDDNNNDGSNEDNKINNNGEANKNIAEPMVQRQK